MHTMSTQTIEILTFNYLPLIIILLTYGNRKTEQYKLTFIISDTV